jgi:nitroimidazol reductase NimA-like FMN-containing flavoprotein (pyridoxamine 5'-phosphate oxidase superfamily)
MLIDDGLELLDDDECARLLSEGEVGRVGITVAGLPVILPVNYAFVDGAVMFRTGEGTKLHAATEHSVIAFEVDAYDALRQVGWSVLAIGRAETVDEPNDRTGLDGRALAPWAAGSRDVYVRLRPEMLSGRRIVARA